MENRNRLSNELSIDLYRVQGANRLRTTMGGGKLVGSVCALEEYGTNSLYDGAGERGGGGEHNDRRASTTTIREYPTNFIERVGR